MWRHSNWEKTRRQIVPDDRTAHKSLLKLLFRSERGHRRTAGAHRRQGRQQGIRTHQRQAPRRSGRARRTQLGPHRGLRRCQRELRRRPRQQRSRIRGGGWPGWRLKWGGWEWWWYLRSVSVYNCSAAGRGQPVILRLTAALSCLDDADTRLTLQPCSSPTYLSEMRPCQGVTHQ
jgi:hypothetical protein